MSEDSRKIASMDTSLELSEFLSEAELSSESPFLSEAGAIPPAPDEIAAAPATVASTEKILVLGSALERKQATEPDNDLVREPAPPTLHVGPATVTDFPVKTHVPAALAFPFLAPGPVALVDLIERRGGFDWREAVAVIHQICRYLREHPPGAPILLDPRNIQITDDGEVYLLSGQTSSDPLVIQVGRLLRTMLMGKEAPPELRLLLSQATFELPIFESIEDVDRALAQLNKLDEPGPAGLALLRAVAAPQVPVDDEVNYRPAAPLRSILPAQRSTARRPNSRATFFGSLLGGYAAHVAVIVVGLAALVALFITRPALLFPPDPPPPAAVTVAIPAPAVTPAPEPVVEAAPSKAPAIVRGVEPTPPPTALPSTPPPVPFVARAPQRAAVAAPADASTRRRDIPRPVMNTPRPAATAGIVISSRVPAPTAKDSELRATSLLAQGQAAEAAMAFDSLVLSRPLYELKATDVTPEALSAFRTSQRLLLPAIAQRDYDRAKAALADGDAARALALAKEAAAIIDRRLADTPPQLREQLGDVIEQATAAAAAADEIIYTELDADVVPPRPLSRQMPLSSPIDVPPNRIGWLDMVIATDGSVYSVKLHTPLNRHHERMIVSPAKAWRYRPATKNGRPVMYRILVKVNLPESGTEF